MKRNYALRRALARALFRRRCPAETDDLGVDPLVYGVFGRFRLRLDDWREIRTELARMREGGFVRGVPGYEETWVLDGELRAAMESATGFCPISGAGSTTIRRVARATTRVRIPSDGEKTPSPFSRRHEKTNGEPDAGERVRNAFRRGCRARPEWTSPHCRTAR